MLRAATWITLASAALLLGAPQGAAQDAPDVLLVGATLIDGTGADAVPDGWIWLKGDRIHAVGSGEPPSVEGGDVRELNGKSVIPGLGDMHVHLRDLERARWFLKALLAHGVTAVLETGNSLGNIAAIRRWSAENGPVPHYYASNSPLQGSTEELRFLRNGREVESAIENYAAFGIDFIKTYNFLSSMGLAQTVELANEHDITVIGHTPLSGSSVTAFDAGLEIMQHLRLRPYEVIDDLEIVSRYPIDEPLMERTGFWAHLDPEGRNLRQTLDLWEERKDEFFVTPTLVAHEGVVSAYEYPEDSARVEAKPGVDFVSEGMLSGWRERSPPSEAWGDLNDEELAEAQATVDGMATFLGLAHQRGVRVLSGTDAPVPWVVPGVSLHHELAHFVEKSGMTPVEAIHSSTGLVAQAVESPERGTIEEGKIADLVVVDGNVAEDIRALANIETVILAGRAYTHEELMAEARTWASRDPAEPEEEEEEEEPEPPPTQRGPGLR